MHVRGNRRIAVSAVGASGLSALGADWESTWAGLLRGESGLSSPQEMFADWAAAPPVGVVASGLLPRSYEGRLEALLSLCLERVRPAVEAIHSADRNARGCIMVASSHGDPAPIARVAARPVGGIPAKVVERCLDDDIYWSVASETVPPMPVSVVHGACASGIVATVNAAAALAGGWFHYVVVVAADALSRVAFEGFQRVGAMSASGCRPFDASRDGMSAAEGGVAYVVFDRERIECPGRHVLFLGGSYNCDGAGGVEPSCAGLTEVIGQSLKAAEVPTEAVDFAYWHGTGTHLNDQTEVEAASRVWRKRPPLGVSLKGAIGHTMGAAAGFNVLGAMQKEGAIA